MKDFFDALGAQIAEAGRAEEARLRRARARRRKARPVVVAVAVVAAVIAVVVAIPGSSPEKAFAGFPVLERPITDASRIPIAPELRRHGAELKRARAFETPFGIAYALPTNHGGLCLALPDAGGGFEKACDPRQAIERRGLPLGIRSAARQHRVVLFAVLLPSGATAPIATVPNGHAMRLDYRGGVASGVVTPGAVVTYAIRGRVVRIATARVIARPRRVAGVCSGAHGHARVVPRPGSGQTSCR